MMPPCLSLRDWYESGKSTPCDRAFTTLSHDPGFFHFTVNHYTPMLLEDPGTCVTQAKTSETESFIPV